MGATRTGTCLYGGPYSGLRRSYTPDEAARLNAGRYWEDPRFI